MEQFIPYLQMAATAAGAGYAGQFVFQLLRTWFPCPTEAPAKKLTRVFYEYLYVSRNARKTVFALSALIAVSASTLLALLTGTSTSVALDSALAIIAGQLMHGQTMKDTVWNVGKV